MNVRTLPFVVATTLIVVTLALLTWHQLGMNKWLYVTGNTDYKIEAIDDRPLGGRSVANVKQTDKGITLSCKLSSSYQWPFCEVSIRFADPPDGIDLSSYESIILDIDTFGKERYKHQVRVSLRNFGESYSKVDDAITLKVNELRYNTLDVDGPLEISLEAFQVATWWINELEIKPSDAMTDVSNINFIEITTREYVREESLEIHINSISFKGKWIQQESLYLFIITMWLTAAFVVVVIYIFTTRRAISNFQNREAALAKINVALELEKRELKELAHQDFLTKCYNRLGLRNHLFELVSSAQRYGTGFSIILMDLDKFKQINDTYGHDVGDQILIDFADLILTNIRGVDIFGRWGGEEFILLCPRTSLASATQIAEKLRTLVVNSTWVKDIDITCSFGVSLMSETEDISDLIQRCDSALYQAKGEGRNRVCSIEFGAD